MNATARTDITRDDTARTWTVTLDGTPVITFPGDQPHVAAETARELDDVVTRAATEEITLDPGDFEVIDGELFLDGMNPAEWLDAMTMD